MYDLPETQVLAALEELLSWPPIARSPQLARFLSYVVTARIRGEASTIKAYSIAVDVFGRPQTFDPQSDPIVRVQARRLRALIDQFYDEGRALSRVRIELPVGRYVPEFHPHEPRVEALASAGAVATEAVRPAPRKVAAKSPSARAEAAPQDGRLAAPVRRVAPTIRRDRRLQLWGAALAAVALVAVVMAVVAILGSGSSRRIGAGIPAEPDVLVSQFANLSGQPELDSLGRELTRGVADSLEPFEEIHVGLDNPDAPAKAPLPPGTYVVSGIIHPAPHGIEVSVNLARADGISIWNATYARPLAQGGNGEIVASVSRAIARELGPFRGPLHARGRAWLDAQDRPLPAVNSYVCMLTYRLARESGGSIQIADALACLERLLRQQPDAAEPLSAIAWLEMRADISRTVPSRGLRAELAEPLAQAERALALAPESSLIHEHLAAIRNWQERYDASEQDFVAALYHNPLNTDARAGYAIMLSRNLEWVLGGQQAELAISDTPYPSPWYYYPLALNALRDGRLEDALKAGRKAIHFGGGEVGTVISLAAASSLDRRDVIDELLPRLMSMESFRRAGVMPWLSGQIKDPDMLAQIAVDLGRAGVPSNALTAAF